MTPSTALGTGPSASLGVDPRTLVGVRFRRQGRDAATGLDCVGVALAATGRVAAGDYPAGWADQAGAEEMLAAAGLVRVDDGQPGDVVLIDAGARQLHVAVLVADGHVHACARARAVVMVPGPPAGSVIGFWRG